MRFALLPLALLLLVNASARAAYDPGRTVVHNLVTLFSAWSGDRIDSALSSAAAAYIDYNFMAERALGEEHWAKLSASQRREFVATFQRLIEQRYYPRWHKLFYKGQLSFTGEAAAGGDIYVRSLLAIGKKQDTIVWRLHGTPGDYKVISLRVGDKDLLRRLQDRFQRHLEKDGFEGMLAWLKDKADVDDEPALSGSAAAGQPR